MLQGSAYAYYSRNILGAANILHRWQMTVDMTSIRLEIMILTMVRNIRLFTRNNHKGTCVCENVLDSEGNILYPHVIHTMKNGVKVGLVGIVTDYINVWEKKENLVGIKVVDPFEAAKKGRWKIYRAS